MCDGLTTRFISNGEWFDSGTEAFRIKSVCFSSSLSSSIFWLFVGIRHGKLDEEMCGLSDFYKLGYYSE